MPLTVGQMLQDRYRIVALLGQGGMGAVYRAWDTRLDKPVALKEAVPQPGLDGDSLARYREQFRQEAVTLGRLAHPHLVPVTDYFEEQGNDYLVMAFVEGESLADWIRRDGALPEGQVLAWARQLLDALAYCHEQGVLHRDIKPQNVIVTPKGSAVLVDFGLVKLWDPTDPQTRTVMRGMGTPEYAPPEQWGAPGQHTGPRSDLYSLGATLYHALTGQAPPTASERMIYPKQYRTPRELNGKVSAVVDGAVSRAMTLAIDDRWDSAPAMGEALARAMPSKATLLLPEASGDAIPVPQRAPLVYAAERVPAVTAAAATPEGIQSAPVQSPSEGPPTADRSIAASSPAVRHGRSRWRVWALGGVALAALAVVGALRLGGTGDGVRPTATPGPGMPRAGDTDSRAIDGMTMVYVPGGTFAMGSGDAGSDAAPVHEVTLAAFWLDRTEVTNGQYGRCVDAGVCEPGAYADEPDLSGDTYPVVGVSWADAVAYCTWAGGRLPTEAEWEYAAAGTTAPIYPWGDQAPKGRANCYDIDCDDGFESSAPVGSFQEGASWVGALDMAGNVYEWVHDWYGESYYARSPSRDPAGPPEGELRVLRGGSRYDDASYLRVAVRYPSDPALRHDFYGFRCATDAAED